MLQQNETNPKNIIWGATKVITLPSGKVVEIREQNGNDDDILSNPNDANTGANISKFIAAIVVRAFWKPENNCRLSQQEARELLLRDRFCIIFHSRILSIGETMKFTFDWGEDPVKGGKFDYEEDLNRYIWDYDQPFPTEYIKDSNDELVKNPDYDVQRIAPYPVDSYEWQEINLQTGRKVRFKLFNGESQEYMLKLPDEAMTKNTELKARSLQFDNNGEWLKAENFSMFTSREMSEIRTMVNLVDASYNPTTEIENPNTKEKMNYPIMYGKDFFYQEGI
jgi:hypothetical protein